MAAVKEEAYRRENEAYESSAIGEGAYEQQMNEQAEARADGVEEALVEVNIKDLLTRPRVHSLKEMDAARTAAYDAGFLVGKQTKESVVISQSENPDSISWGSEAKGTNMKIYGDFSRPEEFKKKIDVAIKIKRWKDVRISEDI